MLNTFSKDYLLDCTNHDPDSLSSQTWERWVPTLNTFSFYSCIVCVRKLVGANAPSFTFLFWLILLVSVVNV